MSLANIAFYIAILGLIVYRRVQGKPFESTKKLFILPVLVTVLGYQDLAHKSLDNVDVVFAVAGCALSLALGAVRGLLDTIDVRQGTPWVRWGATSVIVFAVNIAAKLILDVASVAAGGTTSGATRSLVLAAGLMLAGEAVVVCIRLQVGQLPAPGDRAATLRPNQAPHARGAWRPAGSSVRDEASRLAEGLLRRLADRRT